MASWELQLLSAVIDNNDFKSLLDEGFNQDIFGNPKALALFQFMHGYYHDNSQYGEVVSKALVSDTFPEISLPEPQQSLPALINLVKKEKRQRQIQALLEQVSKAVQENDPDTAIELIQDKLPEIHEIESSPDVDFASTVVSFIAEDLDVIKSNNGVSGLEFPWDVLTQGTGGIEEGDLIVFYGVPKSMKTWVALKCGMHLYQNCGARVLIYSQEMSLKRMQRRCAVIAGKVSYGDYKDGKLTGADLDRLIDEAIVLEQERLADENQHKRLIFIEGPDGTLDLAALRHKIDTYKPDLVVLDSAYLMVGDAEWKSIAKFTRGLKGLGKATGCRLIAINQANESKAANSGGSRGTAAMSGHQSWVEDADMLFWVIKNAKARKLTLRCTAAREHEYPGIRINAFPADNMEFVDDHLDDYAADDGGESGGVKYKTNGVSKGLTASAITASLDSIDKVTNGKFGGIGAMPKGAPS